MIEECIHIQAAGPLTGSVSLVGAKNAILVTMASTVLTKGTSVITNVPVSADVLYMIQLLESLGARVSFDREKKQLEIDTSAITGHQISHELMRKMRASVLVMGPLLARFGCATIAFPGGCGIGTRPIDYHLKCFKCMGVEILMHDEILQAHTAGLRAERIVLEYPSVGATENVLMAATLTSGTTTIVNAALEPEVLDLVSVLQKMGADIIVQAPNTLCVTGVSALMPVQHEVIVDRLEAGALLLAGAITGGDVEITNACAYDLDVFLMKLREMGHQIITGPNGLGVRLIATKTPEAVSFKTGPYPGFPTDLQAPMMVAQCLATGTCEIYETVFENRFMHVRELQKMGAQIKSICGDKVQIKGVAAFNGAQVAASDIRASCALVLAGMVAQGATVMTGINHWRRGYDRLEDKLTQLGAKIEIVPTELVHAAHVQHAQSDR